MNFGVNRGSQKIRLIIKSLKKLQILLADIFATYVVSLLLFVVYPLIDHVTLQKN